MKIQSKFAEMQTKDNFIKLLEIRKEDSLQKVLMQNMTIGLGSGNFVVCPKGLLTVKMEIVDCECLHSSPDGEEWYDNDCEKHNYKLVFDGYQRIKVSMLKIWIETCKWDTGTPLKELSINDSDWDYNYISENTLPRWIDKNQIWLKDIDMNWLFDDFLKNEEYCLVLSINKEETFKANGWEV